MPERRCENCAAFFEGARGAIVDLRTKAAGECRLLPPTSSVVATPQGLVQMCNHPQVKRDDFCLQFKPNDLSQKVADHFGIEREDVNKEMEDDE